MPRTASPPSAAENRSASEDRLAVAAPSAVEDPSAVEEAAAGRLPCRSHHPDLFFAESPTDVERAKKVCQPCPVRARCLLAALDRREPWGVWGGELFADGVVIPRKRPRGRPRKDEPVPAGPAPVSPAPVSPAPVSPAPVSPAPVSPAPTAPPDDGVAA